MALHEGFIPSGASFLVFTDYCRPSLRLAALMGLRVAHVFTHDSIGLGEDGPTHQPVEHLAALRAIPNLLVFRPADSSKRSNAGSSRSRRDAPLDPRRDAAKSAAAAAQPCRGEFERVAPTNSRRRRAKRRFRSSLRARKFRSRSPRRGCSPKKEWRRAWFRSPAWSGSPSRAKNIVAMSWAKPRCASASRRRSARAGTR